MQADIADIARRHGFSTQAARLMLDALVAGGGTMAQFDDREFGGAGQWMRGGMTMVGDMGNHDLQRRVNALCADLALLVATRGTSAADAWWPRSLGAPASTGAQGNARYAYFPDRRRLAIDLGGAVTVHDTLDHRITGFAQQQGARSSMAFTSDKGVVDVAALPKAGADDLD